MNSNAKKFVLLDIAAENFVKTLVYYQNKNATFKIFSSPVHSIMRKKLLLYNNILPMNLRNFHSRGGPFWEGNTLSKSNEINSLMIQNIPTFNFDRQKIFLIGKTVITITILYLKFLNSEMSVLHNFDVGKSALNKTYLLDQQLFCWRHFLKTEVVQNIEFNILTL